MNHSEMTLIVHSLVSSRFWHESLVFPVPPEKPIQKMGGSWLTT